MFYPGQQMQGHAPQQSESSRSNKQDNLIRILTPPSAAANVLLGPADAPAAPLPAGIAAAGAGAAGARIRDIALAVVVVV
jgi:hypothetical protein